MRKFLSFIIFVFAFFSTAFAKDYKAVLVADIDTGKVLYQENANDLNYPASLTKIMTLYLTFDALEHKRLKLDDYLIVSKYAADAQPVKLGLAAGSKIKVEDAIKAVAVHSANDVARVLAENLQGGKEGSFADLMTRVATEIGLQSMAVYKHFPQYWKYFGIKTWTYNGKTYTNTNRLLGVYPGCDGMKTGFTNKSKYSLVATAKRKDKHLIAVVLGAENKDVRASVATRMLNIGFYKSGVLDDNYNESVQQDLSTHTVAPTYNNPVAKYAQPVDNDKQYSNVSGGAGLQCGAFSTQGAAQQQVQRVKDKTGLTLKIEKNESGLYRVRGYGLTEDVANNAKKTASAKGIDCYVFH